MNIVIFNKVSFVKKNNRSLLDISLALVAGVLFSACLDVPHAPNDVQKISSVNIFAKQFDETIEEPLKINSTEQAELIAEVTPSRFKNKVKYYWFNDDEILDSGATYTISTTYMASNFLSRKFIPDRLVIKDSEGNSLETAISVKVNNPPQILAETIPADGDTLYGNSHTPFLFSWTSYDRDDGKGLNNILEIDGIQYNVGELQQVMQSGFNIGVHSFRILVMDSLGDKDSTAIQEFLVLDTLGAK